MKAIINQEDRLFMKRYYFMTIFKKNLREKGNEQKGGTTNGMAR
jgi:hypothetical protein